MNEYAGIGPWIVLYMFYFSMNLFLEVYLRLYCVPLRLFSVL
jgi:hypothetical protein